MDQMLYIDIYEQNCTFTKQLALGNLDQTSFMQDIIKIKQSVVLTYTEKIITNKSVYIYNLDNQKLVQNCQLTNTTYQDDDYFYVYKNNQIEIVSIEKGIVVQKINSIDSFSFMALIPDINIICQVGNRLLLLYSLDTDYAQIKKSLSLEGEFKYYKLIPYHNVLLLISADFFIKVFDLVLEKFTDQTFIQKEFVFGQINSFIYHLPSNYLMLNNYSSFYLYEISLILKKNYDPQPKLESIYYFRLTTNIFYCYFLDSEQRLFHVKQQSEMVLLYKFPQNIIAYGVIKKDETFISGFKQRDDQATKLYLFCYNKGVLKDQLIIQKQYDISQKYIETVFLFQQTYSIYVSQQSLSDGSFPEQQLIFIDYHTSTLLNIECKKDKLSFETIINLNNKKLIDSFIIQLPQLQLTDLKYVGFYYYDDHSFYFNDQLLLSPQDSLTQGKYIKLTYIGNGQYFGLIKEMMCYLYEIQQNMEQIPQLITKIPECYKIFYSNQLIYYTKLRSKRVFFTNIKQQPFTYSSLIMPCLDNNKLYFFGLKYVALYCNLQINIYTNDLQVHKLLRIIPFSEIKRITFNDNALFLSNQKFISIYYIVANQSSQLIEKWKEIKFEHTYIVQISKEYKNANLFYQVMILVNKYFQTIQIFQDTTYSQFQIKALQANTKQLICYSNFQIGMNYDQMYQLLKNIDENSNITHTSINNHIINLYNYNMVENNQLLEYLEMQKKYSIRFINQPMVLGLNEFNSYLIQLIPHRDLVIIDKKLVFPKGQNLEIANNFNCLTIILQNIQIGSNHGNTLYLRDLSDVYINTILIDGSNDSFKNHLIYFKNITHVTIKNLEISNLQENTAQQIFFFNRIGQITFENVTIKNCINLQAITAFTLLQIQQFNVTNLNIYNVSLNLEDNQFFSNNIFITAGVKSIYFKDFKIWNIRNLNIQSSTIQYDSNNNRISVLDSQIIHQNIKIEDSISTSSLFIINDSQYILQSSIFNSITLLNDDGSVLALFASTKAKIEQTRIVNSKALSGGAIQLQQCSDILITSSLLQNNTAVNKGGAIIVYSSNLFIQSSSITDNTSLIGGGIYYQLTKPLFVSIIQTRSLSSQQDISIQDSQLFNNHAEIFGDNIASELNKILVYSIKSYDSSQIHFVNEEFIEINQFRSGDSLEFQFQILDEEGNSIKFEIEKMNQYSKMINEYLSQLTIEIFSQDDQKVELSNQIISSYRDFNSKTKRWTSSILKIIKNPSSQIILRIQSQKVKNKEELYTVNLKITFRTCILGEIFGIREDLVECIPCPKGFYSLVTPQNNKLNECTPCPESAFECSKNQILLKEGYWRSSNDTDDILHCQNNPSNCIGSKEGNINYCKEGHIGALCESCDSLGEVWHQRYMRRRKLGCLSCDEINDYLFILPLIFIIILILAYVVISISQAIKISKSYTYAYYFRQVGLINMGTSAIKDQTPFYVKQLMHYMQIASIINKYDFEIPDILKFFPQVISLPIENIEYTFDCLLNKMDQKIPIIFVRALWSLLIPMFYGIALLMIYATLLVIKRIKHNKFFAFNGLFFMLIFLESNVISRLVSIISCRKIGSKSFTHNDSSYECYTNEHVIYSLYIILPGMLIWTALIPLIILRSLIKNKNNLDSLFVRFKFGFLYQEFKQKFYYWEFIKSYKKILIVIIYNFYYDYSQFYSIIICGILLIYIIYLQKLTPYQQIQFNQIDNGLMILIIALILINILIQDTQIDWIQNLGRIIAALLYNSVIILFICKIISVKVHIHFFKQVYFVKRFFIHNIPFLNYCISLKKPINSIRAQKNWRKVKDIIEHKRWNVQNFSKLQASLQFKSKLSQLNNNHIQNIPQKGDDTFKSKFNISKTNIINLNDRSERIFVGNSDCNLIEMGNILSPQEINRKDLKDYEQNLGYFSINPIENLNNNPQSAFSLNNHTKISSQDLIPQSHTNGSLVFKSKTKPITMPSQKIIQCLNQMSGSSEASSISSSEENDKGDHFDTLQEQKNQQIGYKQNSLLELSVEDDEFEEIYNENEDKNNKFETNNNQWFYSCNDLNKLNSSQQIPSNRPYQSCPNLLNLSEDFKINVNKQLGEQLSSLDYYVRNRVVSKMNYTIPENYFSQFNQYDHTGSDDLSRINELAQNYMKTINSNNNYSKGEQSEMNSSPKNNNHLNSQSNPYSFYRSSISKKKVVGSSLFKSSSRKEGNKQEKLLTSTSSAKEQHNDKGSINKNENNYQTEEYFQQIKSTPQNEVRDQSISQYSNQSDYLDLKNSKDGSSHTPIPSVSLGFSINAIQKQ